MELVSDVEAKNIMHRIALYEGIEALLPILEEDMGMDMDED